MKLAFLSQSRRFFSLVDLDFALHADHRPLARLSLENGHWHTAQQGFPEPGNAVVFSRQRGSRSCVWRLLSVSLIALLHVAARAASGASEVAAV